MKRLKIFFDHLLPTWGSFVFGSFIGFFLVGLVVSLCISSLDNAIQPPDLASEPGSSELNSASNSDSMTSGSRMLPAGFGSIRVASECLSGPIFLSSGTIIQKHHRLWWIAVETAGDPSPPYFAA